MLWRNTGLPITIFGIDARPFVLVLFLPIHLRLWTVGLVGGLVLFFGLLAFKKLTLPVLWRRMRHKMSGRYRVARPAWYWHRWRPRWWIEVVRG